MASAFSDHLDSCVVARGRALVPRADDGERGVRRRVRASDARAAREGDDERVREVHGDARHRFRRAGEHCGVASSGGLSAPKINQKSGVDVEAAREKI